MNTAKPPKSQDKTSDAIAFIRRKASESLSPQNFIDCLWTLNNEKINDMELCIDYLFHAFPNFDLSVDCSQSKAMLIYLMSTTLIHELREDHDPYKLTHCNDWGFWVTLTFYDGWSFYFDYLWREGL